MATIPGITDEKGKAYQKQAAYLDPKVKAPYQYQVDGTSYSVTELSPESVNALTTAAQSGSKVYRTSEGGFTNNIYNADFTGQFNTSIDIDTKNKKVNIKAPESVLKSESFKTQIQNNDAFKQLAKGYINNPDGEIELSDGTTKKTSEMLDEYRKALQNIADMRPQMDALAENQEKLYGLTGLNDQQLIISASGVNSGSDKKDVVYLPAQNIGGYDFSQLDSFNADELTISVEDFDKFNVGKAFDDQHVKKALAEAKAAMLTFSQAKQDEDFEYSDTDKNDAVRWQAFYSSLLNRKAHLTAPAYIGNAIEGIVTGIGENSMELAVGIADALQFVGSKIGGDITITTGEGELHFGIGPGDAMMQTGRNLRALAAIGDFFEDILQNPELTAKSDGAGKAYTKLGASLADAYGLPVSDEWRKQAEEINTLFVENYELRDSMSSALGVGRFIGNLIGEGLRQTAFVNPVGRVVEKVFATGGSKLASGLSSFTKMISKYGTPKEIASLARVGILAEEAASALAKGNNVLATISNEIWNVTAQGIVDTITHDSEAMAKLYADGDTAGLANELWTNLVWNTIGEVGAFGGSNIIKAIGETKVGQQISLVYGKAVNALAALKNQAKLAVENKLGKLKIFKDQLGAGTRVYVEGIIEAEKKAAKAATIEEFESAIKDRVFFENALDAKIRGPRAELNLMRKNPIMSATLEAYDKSTTDLTAALKKAGETLMTESKVTQEVANYLSIKAQLARALNDPKLAGGEWAESLQNKINDIGKSLENKGLKTLADNNFTNLQKARAQLTKYQLNQKVIDADTIQGYRDTGYWGKEGEEYVETRRIKNTPGGKEDVKTALDEYYKSIDTTGVSKFHAQEAENYKLYKVDLDEDFLDPNVVFAGEMYRTAKSIQGRNNALALLNSSSVNKTLGGVESTKANARSVKNFREYQNKVLSDITKRFGEDYKIDLELMFPEFSTIRSNNAEELAKLSKQKTAAAKSYNKAVDAYAGMQLDANDIAEIRVGLSEKVSLPDFDPANMNNDSFQEMITVLDKKTSALLQSQVDSVLGDGAVLSLDNYKQVYEAIEGLDTTLTRSYINNSSDIKKSKTYKDTIRRVKSENNNFQDEAFLNKYQKKYDELAEKYKELQDNPFSLSGGGKAFKESVDNMVSGIREQFTATIKESSEGRQLVQAMVDGGLDEDTAIQYLVVDTLHRMNPASGKKANRALKNSVEKYMTSDEVVNLFEGVSAKDLKGFSNMVGDITDDIIESEWNTMTRSLIDNGHSDMVDMDEVFERVQSYAEDILGDVKDSRKSIIEVLGEDGRLQYIETDPLTKDLYEWQPDYSDSTPSAFLSLTNRLFRLGTTNLKASSFVRQWIKDPINAYVAGGAVPFLNRGMSNFFGSNAYAKINDSIVEELQDKIIAGLKTEFGDEGWRLFEIQAKEQGKDIGRAAVEYELITRPQAISSAGGTENKFYQDLTKARSAEYAYEYGGKIGREKRMGIVGEKLNSALETLEDVIPNNARETYLRNLVYGEQFQQAISKGKSINEARAIAERFMADATTNFSRPLAMGNRIARSIPYLSAAFNGKASFFRLLELDPAGVTGRFLGGLVLPYMALLAESMGKAENAEVYRNMKEYEKEGNLAIVVNGQPVTIPIPDELSAILNPFRQAVEKAYGANDHSWSELIANDLLQLPVMDISGFYDLDQNEYDSNPTFWERVGRGSEKLIFGQMAPAIVKSAYMFGTGRDPYTGFDIDKSYVYDDNEGGVQIMDSNDNKIANAVSSWAKNVGIDLSASAAYSILGSMFGKGLLGAGDTLVSILSGQPTSAFSETTDSLQGVFIVDARNRAAQDWKSEVSALYDKKKALMDSDEYSNYIKAIGNSSISEEKRQEYLSNWKTYVQNYTNEVLNAAKIMHDKYGMTVNQQASVISLLTFGESEALALTAEGREQKTQLYYQARSLAINTMQQMGFQGTTDLSIFGYGTYQTNPETGQKEYKYKYNSPVDILNMESNIWGASSITLGNIKNIIGKSISSDKLSAYYDQRSEMYDKAKNASTKSEKNKVYNELEKMDATWNSQVMKLIVPYIDNYGLGNILGNKELTDYLEKYIFVPTSIMGKAQYMSSSNTGIDKNEAFIEYYVNKWYEKYNKVRKGDK